jgi:hypothetical protein
LLLQVSTNADGSRRARCTNKTAGCNASGGSFGSLRSFSGSAVPVAHAIAHFLAQILLEILGVGLAVLLAFPLARLEALFIALYVAGLEAFLIL